MSTLLEQASLVLIPSGYKEDVVYSQIPTNGNGDLSFTRASNGTRINSAGLVEVCPWNLVQQSETFDNASWAKNTGGTSTVTVTANSGIAPNGTTTADRIQLTRDSLGFAQVIQTVTTTTSQSYTFSVYLKSLSGTPTVMFGSFGGTNTQTATLTNEWVRYTWTATSPSTSAFALLMIWGGVGSTSLSADFLAWGYQLVEGSSAKPYFPTTDRLNVPRLTYQNGGGGCPSLLLEKQSTNYVKYSQDFTQSDWTQSGATITANAIISPDGTQNATRVQFSAGSRYVYQTIGGSGIAAGSVTISCWIKGASVQKIGFSDGNANPNEITLTTDWQRYTFTFTYSSGGIGVQFDNYFGVTPSAQTKDFYIWGAQSEQSTYATSYIPTTSASATRVIDDCRKTGISSLIGQTEGTMFIDLNLTAWDSNSFYFGLYGGGNEIYFRCAGTGAIDFVHYFGATQAFITKSGLSLGRHKLAACYKNNDWAFYVDGILVGTDTSGTFSGTISQMVFGYTSISAYPPFQSVNQTILFPTRLTNAELASLTTI
jgi:hypothetical protein